MTTTTISTTTAAFEGQTVNRDELPTPPTWTERASRLAVDITDLKAQAGAAMASGNLDVILSLGAKVAELQANLDLARRNAVKEARPNAENAVRKAIRENEDLMSLIGHVFLAGANKVLITPSAADPKHYEINFGSGTTSTKTTSTSTRAPRTKYQIGDEIISRVELFNRAAKNNVPEAIKVLAETDVTKRSNAMAINVAKVMEIMGAKVAA